MIQPFNQMQTAMYQQNRSVAENREATGLTGANEAQAMETGLRPEEIVPAATNAQENGTKAAGKDGKGNKRNFDSFECETCKNRKYQDGSDGPGVSFKTPSKLSPDKAASAVRSHEQEHVTREQAKAQREDREVVSQSVTYQTAVCPECGKIYVSGGTTKTVTKGQVEQTYGLSGNEEKGKYLDRTA